MKDMTHMKIPALLLLLLLGMAFPAMAAAVTPVTPATAQAPGNQREIEYGALERHVGEHIVVHTTNGTVRSGTLVKFTNVNVTVRLGPESGSIDLTLPRNTVRKAFVTIKAADPLFPNDTFQQETNAGAQKN